MKNKQNIKSSELQIINGENQAAQLAVIAGLITTLGDGLATVAAAMALQEAQQNNSNNINTYPDVQMMQKRIDALEFEVKQMKKMLRTSGY